MRVEDILHVCSNVDCLVRVLVHTNNDTFDVVDEVEVSNFYDAPAIKKIEEKIRKMETYAPGSETGFIFIKDDPQKAPVLIIHAVPVWKCKIDDVDCRKTGCIRNGGPCKSTTKWEDSIYFKED
jgi:hypothetical protein